MGDPLFDSISSLFSSSGADPADVLDFRRTVRANDPYRNAAAPILSAKFDTSTWSPGATFGVTAGQAFLGSLLNALGVRDEAAQVKTMTAALPELYKNPQTPIPAGVDQSAGEALRAATAARAESETNKVANSVMANLFAANPDLGLALLEEKLNKKSATTKEATPSNTGNKLASALSSAIESAKDKRSVDSPIEKKVADLRGEFNKLEEVQNYKYVQRLSNQLIKTIKNPSAVADPILAKMVVQFVEPKLAVNAGEAAALAASTSIPEAWKGIIGQALEGKSKFTEYPEIKKGLLDIASSALEAHGSAYSQTYNQFKKEAARFGIDPERISSLGEPVSFEALSLSGGGTDKISRLTAIRDELASGNVSEERKQTLLKEAQDLASPPSTASGVPLG